MSSRLSPDEIRADFAPWFEIVALFNELGMRVLPAVSPGRTNNQQLIAALLYGRTLKSFQATCLLAERGMLSDARTIVRAAAETAIVLCAVAKDAKVCDLLIDRHYWHRRKLIASWLSDKQAIANTAETQADALRATLASSPRLIKSFRNNP